MGAAGRPAAAPGGRAAAGRPQSVPDHNAHSTSSTVPPSTSTALARRAARPGRPSRAPGRLPSAGPSSERRVEHRPADQLAGRGRPGRAAAARGSSARTSVASSPPSGEVSSASARSASTYSRGGVVDLGVDDDRQRAEQRQHGRLAHQRRVVARHLDRHARRAPAPGAAPGSRRARSAPAPPSRTSRRRPRGGRGAAGRRRARPRPARCRR